MATRKRTPHALENYVRPCEEATTLVLLTSTLGCSINWLGAQFIAASLGQGDSLTDGAAQNTTCVVLASWVRDLAYWRSEIRRGTVSIILAMTKSVR
jgi:elongator complex protein 6